MLATRLIPILYLKNGLIVRSQEFKNFKEFGNPINQFERLNDWGADEIVYIDISRDKNYDMKRDDHKINRHSNIHDILKDIAARCFVPLTFGGNIEKLEDAEAFFRLGADKVIVNTALYRNENLAKEISTRYGNQALVAGVDVKKEGSQHHLYINKGRERLSISPLDWAKKLEEMGAGEIFINSIDRDGLSNGYDEELIQKICDSVNLPVIAAGGAGMFDDFYDLAKNTSVSAVAAGNIFNFTENAYLRAKKFLHQKKLNFR